MMHDVEVLMIQHGVDTMLPHILCQRNDGIEWLVIVTVNTFPGSTCEYPF